VPGHCMVRSVENGNGNFARPPDQATLKPGPHNPDLGIADDYPMLTDAPGSDAMAVRQQIAEVLAGLGLRFSAGQRWACRKRWGWIAEPATANGRTLLPRPAIAGKGSGFFEERERAVPPGRGEEVLPSGGLGEALESVVAWVGRGFSCGDAGGGAALHAGLDEVE
jgi:hypothetical protein